MAQNSTTFASADATRSKRKGLSALQFSSRIGKSQLAVYSRQLATLLKAGVPIVQALKVLQKQERTGKMSILIRDQISELEGGASFSQTLKSHDEVFDRMYVSLVVAGEKAGVLDQVMSRLAHYLERSVQTSGKIRSALAYPVVVLCASILIVSGLLIFVVPQFESIFNSMLQGAALPPMTQWVLKFSRFLQQNGLWVFFGLFLLFVLVRISLKLPVVSMAYDRLKLWIPVMGRLQLKSTLARFCRTFGTLLDSAVPILDAIDTSAKTLNNRVLERVFEKVKYNVRDGESIASSLEREASIPPVLVGMTEVGEASGELPSMLLQIAETYEQEVETGVNSLTTLIEPLMILALAVVIGFLVIALFLPIVEIMQHLGT